MNTAQIETHLEKVKDLQQLFKSDRLRALVQSILGVAVDKGGVWPDEVNVESVAMEDRNCIGSAWRWLCNAGLLTRTSNFRRSQSDNAKGRTIFFHKLTSERLARLVIGKPKGEPSKPEQMKLTFDTTK